MKTVIILAGFVALALAATVPSQHTFKTKPVDAAFVERQRKILTFFYNVNQVDTEAEYFKIGKDYDVEANIEHYTNKKAVEEFLVLYRTGFLPKHHVFSPFYERLREEAIALFHLFYYAKDFETFYKTAAFARVHLNEGQFLYAYYIAVLHREDTMGFVVPAPYEVYPEFFTNKDDLYKIYRNKMQGGIVNPELALTDGVVKENDYYVFYANYSNSLSYPNEEEKLSYFTEDIGLNSYYYYFHSQLPFWWNADSFGPFKERRGEMYFYFYQQLLARYYMERLTNGLGKTPEFSWFSPIKTGYYPFLSTFYYPFAQRSNYYDLHTEKNYEKVRFLDAYEMTFFQYLQRGHFKAFNHEIDFHNSKAVNFVGNYWQTNADLYEEDVTQDYQRSYEITARHVLGGAPEPFDKYTFMPTALDFYQTSLRDPVFYQMYNRLLDNIVKFKEYLVPYTQDNLHFVGVKVNEVKVDKLVTFFDYFDYDASNTAFFKKEQLSSYPHGYKIRQPRLNHKSFNVDIELKSDVTADAVVKIFIGPKYDSNGFPITVEENWMNFVELDWSIQKLIPGQNKIERSSDDFFFYKEDSVPISDVLKLLDQGKVPVDMSEEIDSMPNRLMLPRGTKGGFPFQFIVYVYPYNPIIKEDVNFRKFNVLLDNKPFGYPLDRPIQETTFKQPNMFMKDVFVYHEGEEFTYKYNVPSYIANVHKN